MAASIIQEMRKTKQFVPWKEFSASFEQLRFFNAEKPDDEIKVMAEFMNDIGIIGWFSTVRSYAAFCWWTERLKT